VFISFDHGRHWQSLQAEPAGDTPWTTSGPPQRPRISHGAIVLVMDNITRCQQVKTACRVRRSVGAGRMSTGCTRHESVSDACTTPSAARPDGADTSAARTSTTPSRGQPRGRHDPDLDAKGSLCGAFSSDSRAARRGTRRRWCPSRFGPVGYTGAEETRHNRFTWDCDTPPSGGGSGPHVVPALRVRCRSHAVASPPRSRSLDVKIDPRVMAAGVTRPISTRTRSSC